MKMSMIKALAAAVLAAGSASGQDLTRVAPAQTRMVIIRNATVHPVAKQALDGGAVAFADGKVTGVYTGKELEEFLARSRFAAPGPEFVDAKGKHVYPGLVAAYSTLGVSEIASLRQSKDSDEVGDVTPEVTPATAVNPDSTLIPVARAGGVFAAGIFPGGGTVPGQVSVIRLHGWTSDDLAVERSSGVAVSWPWMRGAAEDGPRGGGGGGDRGDAGGRQDSTDGLARIREVFDRARAYDAERRAFPDRSVDLRWEAMRPLFAEGEKQARVFVSANDVDQITSAAAFLGERKLKGVIVGGRDAALAAEMLKKYDIPVILEGTHKLPKRADSAYDEVFRTPAVLKGLGVRFCIASGEEPANERNLNHAAGTAAAYGLPQDDAVRAITQWAAEILGVGDRLGTIEAGRPATLLLADGNILEVTTRVERGWIDGRAVDLSNKQTELLKKYEEKYRQRGELK